MADNGSHLDTRIAKLKELISLYPQNGNFVRQLYGLEERQRWQIQGQTTATSGICTEHTTLTSFHTSKADIASLRDSLFKVEACRVNAEADVATHIRMYEQYIRQTTEAKVSDNFKVCQPLIKKNANINVNVASERVARSNYTPNANANQSKF